MCYQKFHGCKYCGAQYLCDLQNWVCPTISNDEDRNMCDECRARLEKELAQIDLETVSEIDIEDLLK